MVKEIEEIRRTCLYDVVNHSNLAAHKNQMNAGAGSRQMDSFLLNVNEDLELAAMEATQTYHMLQENQSFAILYRLLQDYQKEQRAPDSYSHEPKI